jgi:hypothetical protein
MQETIWEFPLDHAPGLISSGMSKGCHELKITSKARQNQNIDWMAGRNLVGAAATEGIALLISLPEPDIKEWSSYRGKPCVVRLSNQLFVGQWEGQYSGSGTMVIILRNLEPATAGLTGKASQLLREYERLNALTAKYRRLSAKQGQSQRHKAANKAKHYATGAKKALRQLSFIVAKAL